MRTVIIVESNAEMMAVTCTILTLSGCNPIPVNRPETLFALMNKVNPEVILMGLDGYEGMKLCVRLKQNSKYAHIPVILLSESTPLEDDSHVLYDGFIVKPFSMAKFTAALNVVFKEKE